MTESAERLHDYLDLWAERQPDTEFAVQGARRLTYREAQRATVRLANAFVSAGLRPGDRIAVLAKNCVEYPLIYLAASRAGVVPAPLNYRSAPTEWEYVIHDPTDDGFVFKVVARGDRVFAAAINTTFGSAWLRPLNILQARYVKFGAQLLF